MIDIIVRIFIAVAQLAYPPCEWEDSYACYWDASEMGDGNGQSFIVGPQSDDDNQPRWILYHGPFQIAGNQDNDLVVG